MNFLTSIRGLAALLVVFYHIKHYLLPLAFLGVFSPLFADGYLAVDFFLVLSGFIISYKYAVDFKAGVSANYLDFMSRRLARIYPLHAFVMLCFLTLPIGLYVTGRGYDSSTFGVGSFLAKLFLLDLWWVGTPTWTRAPSGLSRHFQGQGELHDSRTLWIKSCLPKKRPLLIMRCSAGRLRSAGAASKLG